MLHTKSWSETVRLALAIALLGTGTFFVERGEAARDVDPLHKLNESVQSLAKRVSPSVVQVLVTGYAPVEPRNLRNTDVVIGTRRSAASGVVVGADGYILTNAHVIAGAQRVEVVLSSALDDTHTKSATPKEDTLEARIIGVAREVDLALLKVERANLQALPFADYNELRQGELVFAFGSPQGLRNSLTMGVVSAVARQIDPDNPMVYVQTDAPINHGNSGGPLVNVNGQLVGINTFFLSSSGGSEGLGFAIPSALVEVVYPKLKQHGYLRRAQVGMLLQTNSPTLAKGLGIIRDSGAVVTDVLPGSPADVAGLLIQDVIVSIDGRPLESLLPLALYMFGLSGGDHVRLGVLRGTDILTLDVDAVESTAPSVSVDNLAELVHPNKAVVEALGVVAVAIDNITRPLLPQLRIPTGVVVLAHSTRSPSTDIPLTAGDVIHAINGRAVSTVDELELALYRLEPHNPVVLQVERKQQLSFVTLELE